MGHITFEGYRVIKLYFENRLTENIDFNLENTINTRVNFDMNNHKCICTYTIIMENAKLPQIFKVEAEINGLCSFEEGMTKPQIHVEASKIVFPYLKAVIANLTSVAGSVPIFIPELQLNEADIKSLE